MKIDRSNICMNDVAFINNRLFFSAVNFNALFTMDIGTKQLNIISNYPEEELQKTRMHSCCIVFKNEIIFAPDLSEYIAIYNIETEDIELIKFPTYKKNSKNDLLPKVGAMKQAGGNIYMFGYAEPMIVKLNVLTKELKVIDQWFEEFKKFGVEDQKPFFGGDICQRDDVLFVKNYQNNALMEFDAISETSTFYDPGDMPLKINTLCDDGRNLWMFINKERALGCWNIETCDIDRKVQSEELSLVKKNIAYSLYLNGAVWLFPVDIDPIIVVDLDTGYVRRDDRWMRGKKKINLLTGTACCFAKKIGNSIYYMMANENVIHKIEERGEENDIPLLWEKEKEWEYFSINKEICKDDIKDFSEYIVSRKTIKYQSQEVHSLIGNNIYQRMKERNI